MDRRKSSCIFPPVVPCHGDRQMRYHASLLSFLLLDFPPGIQLSLPSPTRRTQLTIYRWESATCGRRKIDRREREKGPSRHLMRIDTMSCHSRSPYSSLRSNVGGYSPGTRTSLGGGGLLGCKVSTAIPLYPGFSLSTDSAKIVLYRRVSLLPRFPIRAALRP